jgi:RNA polymerase sigma-70 factor (ECF subfamily)
LNDEASDLLDEHLAKARLGERSALAALVRAHQRSVYSLALRMLGTRDLAEDLTQEVFMQMNDNLRSIESSRHLTFWLRQVTSNRAIDQLRRRARISFTPLDDETPIFSEQDAPDPLLQRHLRTLLADLSPPARAVLLLRFQEDLDPTEIAQTLNMPLNTVKSHLKRSLDTLREKTAGTQPLRHEGTP